jgi:hypothetical protein
MLIVVIEVRPPITPAISNVAPLCGAPSLSAFSLSAARSGHSLGIMSHLCTLVACDVTLVSCSLGAFGPAILANATPSADGGQIASRTGFPASSS